MKILLCGGGTAGHAWPVILVAEALSKNKRNQVLYVGSAKIEKELSQKSGITFKRIIAGKKRAYSSILNIFDVFKTGLGILQSYFLFLFFRPAVIFAKGGYVTVPVIFWAKFFKVPLVIHESDSVMGQANLWAAPRAKKICLGFPVKYYANLTVPLERLIYTGIPIKTDFYQTPVKTGETKKLLITGGSQGSRRINKVISEILPKLIEKYEVWHLSGEGDYEELSQFKHPSYHLFDFSYEMSKLVRDADLVVTRAGASTLAEISAAKKAAIIIPLPESANNHQTKNAKVYTDLNAAIVCSEAGLTASSLESIINDLMADDSLRDLLGHHAAALARPQAVAEIVDAIFEATYEK
ncbi:MAG: UDP-N-acetylglucosamine--N-acetylmuramyl-(pentapeptide) pyrophosphoryl-undecaprenol N-acetylglucosamine transferase [Patescibacteria group bacterium]|jgi:UDP-N-acetylglucosamine--N-acetylmuramyl-(pentapeptide) pyrophosphoryl-undecaprenol N-acetylglucosamine transferase